MVKEWKIKGNIGSHGVRIIGHEGWYEAYIKCGGCCEVVRYYNQPEGEDYNQIHICDIPAFIEILQSIEKYRVQYFTEQGTLD